MASGHEFCLQCGAQLETRDKFCPVCGVSTQEQGLATVSSAMSQPPPPAVTAAYLDSPAPPPLVAGASYAVVEPPPPITTTYGGFWIRVGAALLDALALAVGFIVLEAICNLVVFGLGVVLAGLLELVGAWLYSAKMESSARQATLGKMAFGLKVTDLEGRRISFARASVRFLATYVLGLILAGLGYLVVAFTPKKQGLHDLIAGTLVVRER